MLKNGKLTYARYVGRIPESWSLILVVGTDRLNFLLSHGVEHDHDPSNAGGEGGFLMFSSSHQALHGDTRVCWSRFLRRENPEIES